MKNSKNNQADFISPLIINGLHGRVLKIPASKKAAKREILLIYGHHSSLERMYGIAESLSKYGNVTMPDLPGFGGMDSFYKIDEKPTIDNLADYLATFIMLNYKKRPITIGAMSFGFVVVTRMLQKYPRLVSQVDLLVSMVGFSHKKDFKLKKRTLFLFRYGSSFFSNPLAAAFLKYLILRGPLIKLSYVLLDFNKKMKDTTTKERNRRIAFEIVLWQCNDIRTYMDTTVTMMTLDLTGTKVALPLMNIAVDSDQYFNNQTVNKHLKLIFSNVKTFKAKMPNHAPTVISSAKDVDAFFTKEIRKELNKAPKR